MKYTERLTDLVDADDQVRCRDLLQDHVPHALKLLLLQVQEPT